MRRIVVHIDHLVLRGFPHGERHAVAAGLRHELARLLSEPRAAGRLSRLHGSDRLTLGRVAIEPGASGQAVGGAAGRAVGRAVAP